MDGCVGDGQEGRKQEPGGGFCEGMGVQPSVVEHF